MLTDCEAEEVVVTVTLFAKVMDDGETARLGLTEAPPEPGSEMVRPVMSALSP